MSVDPARRRSLKLIALAGGGLLLQGLLPAAQARASSPAARGAALGYFVELRPDSSIDFVLTRHEMGQGVATALAMIVAEELGADFNLVSIRVPSTAEARYQLNGTGGSTTVKDAWQPLRRGAALARAALVQTAAQRWRVDAAQCTTRDSFVHGPQGQKLGFGELVVDAAGLNLPADAADFRRLQAQAELRPLRETVLLGRAQTNVFARDIVRGAQRYGSDASLPGMLHASVERSPRPFGKLKSIDASAALAVKGVRKVVAIEAMHDYMRGLGAPALFTSSKAGVAVLADSTWAAMQGRRALKVEWEHSGPAHDNASWEAAMGALLDSDAKDVSGHGSAPMSRTGSLQAEYFYPFQAHACMEPLNCLAQFRDGRAEVWVSTQGAGPLRAKIAELWKLKPADVVVHAQFSGGGFGRRSYPDAAVEALRISQAAGGVPVKVTWTREDDLRHDHYHPACLARFDALLSADGRLASFVHSEARCYWGDPASEIPWFVYDCGHLQYRFANAQSSSPLQGGAWRAVVANNWAFGIECFVDELAHAAGRDPLALRRLWLSDGSDKKSGNRYTMSNARVVRVLEALAQKADWGAPAVAVAGSPDSRVGRGMALYPYLHGDSYCAMAIDVALDAKDQVTVTRVVAVVDCGRVINPSGAQAQVEGGILWGLGGALHGGVTLRDGAVMNANLHEAPLLRHHEAPRRIEVHFVGDAQGAPTGLGELAPPLVAPALCNALFAATGKRIRRLPL